MSEQDRKLNRVLVFALAGMVLIMISNLAISIYLSFSIKPVDKESISSITESVGKIEGYAKDLAVLAVLNRSLVTADEKANGGNIDAINKTYNDICNKYKIDCDDNPLGIDGTTSGLSSESQSNRH